MAAEPLKFENKKGEIINISLLVSYIKIEKSGH